MHFTKKMKKSIDDYISGKYLYLVNISFTDLDLYDIAEINNIVNKAYYYLRSNVHSVFCKNTNGMIKKYYINERPDKTFEVGLKIIAAANKEYIPEKIKTSIFFMFNSLLSQSER